jgi:diadenosine tetraphosphate (Ap4A) HIT family hydrolase
MTTLSWPSNWKQLIKGEGCGMCGSARPASSIYGINIHQAEYTDAILQRADIQRGYTLVVWRGRHVNEPFELTDAEAISYWGSVGRVAKALNDHYRPIKMNYETLGNSLPHLHTHLVPRYVRDPAPGRPFPLLPQDGSEMQIPDDRLRADADALRLLLGGAG